MQALLFGRPDLQLFGDDGVRARRPTTSARSDRPRRATRRARARVRLAEESRCAASLAARRRDARSPWISFATSANMRRRSDVVFCIEANPPAYGCDFVTTTTEAVELCALVDHPGIRVNGDLGGMTMNGEDPRAAIASAARFIAHFHASEPHLAELGAAAGSRGGRARRLREIGYERLGVDRDASRRSARQALRACGVRYVGERCSDHECIARAASRCGSCAPSWSLTVCAAVDPVHSLQFRLSAYRDSLPSPTRPAFRRRAFSRTSPAYRAARSTSRSA